MTRLVRTLAMVTSAAGISGIGVAFVPSTAGAVDALVHADNDEHTFCFSTSVVSTAPYRSAMSYLDSSTTMFDNEMSSCATNTDILFREETAGGNRGTEQCLAMDGNGDCQQARIRVDRNVIANDGVDAQHTFAHNLTKTIRHEVGHTLGLEHDAVTYNEAVAAGSTWKDCMVSGRVPDGDAITGRYSGLHVQWVNDRY